MITKNKFWTGLRVLVLIAVALVAKRAWAVENDLPVVHVLATDQWADEFLQDGGTFTIYRSGPTNEPLTISYRMAGTASNGVDYAWLTGTVTIPACAVSESIRFTPIDDQRVEGNETVALFLEPQYQWPPPYVVAWPSYALAYLQDNDFPPTNQPPLVRIVNPPDGSVFPGPADIRLIAHATDLDGRVRTVEFFDGTTSLGVVSNLPPTPRPLPLPAEGFELSLERDPGLYPDLDEILNPSTIRPSVFVLPWENVPPGLHVLTAVATDNQGDVSRSERIEIKVTEPLEQAVVNVRASDPVASEPGLTRQRLDTATFTVGRSGRTDLPLTVFYLLSGGASNGVDYAALPQSVTIQPGASKAEVVIEPLHDTLVEGPEKVVLTLITPPCIAIYSPPYECYQVGAHDAARAVINDNDPVNLPPVVEIVRPLDGSVFLAPVDIVIVAGARDFDGRVRTVEFFVGDTSLGVVSNTPSILPTNAPQFAIKWPDVGAGHYLLTAEATDNDGAKSRSHPVEVKVVERSLPTVVSIEATDPEASETTGTVPNTATLKLKRTGSTARGLLVFYSIGGTASNGTDYELLPRHVMIPPGEATAPIVISPIDDRLVEGAESVSLTVEPPLVLLEPMVSAAGTILPIDYYLVGSNHTARAVIRDNDVSPTNLPPKVAIIQPTDGEIFIAPEGIRICAEARDPDGWVRSVEFFEGTNSLGVVDGLIALEVNGIPPLPDQIFCLKWPEMKPGGYALRARATDNRGASTWSDPVRIRVIDDVRPMVVTIEATDANASEGDWILEPMAMADGKVAFIGPPIIERANVAVFTVSRDRGTNIPLTVYYSLSGTASNGVDYRELDGSVTIPAGAWSARVVVDPIDDRRVEGVETVVAEIAPIFCIAGFAPSPDCYVIGEPGKAVAYIRDNDFGNQPPKIEIAKPEDGQMFLARADIEIVAQVQDSDGYVTQVEFFAGTNSIGVDSRVYIIAPPPGELHRFSMIWSNVPPGLYELTAKATDSEGATSRSTPVTIRVVPPCPVPVVSIETLDKSAAEQDPRIMAPPDVAAVRVLRSCQTNDGLTVRFAIGGTAVNGRDFGPLDHKVTIPAGAEYVDIYVVAIDDQLVEGVETVEFHLLPSDCAMADVLLPDCYLVGAPARAEVYIRDNESFAPKIAIVKPDTGESFQAPAEINIVVQTVDEDGWVPRVEFFANGRSIGVQEINFIIAPPPGQLQRFALDWSNVPPGRYVLTAQATDDRGTTGESGPVVIEVTQSLLPPVVNIYATDAFAREGNPPNTAAFRVRRSGETNAPLTVHFAIRGTASNGVDYVEIPSSVTIPAGRRSASILVTPIDDRRDEPVETVILRLEEAALYNVGRWNRAGAIVVDNDRPRPGPICLTDRNFHVRLEGANGAGYRLEISSDLVNWETLEPNMVSDDAIHFVDPEASELGARFYRVLPVTDVELFSEE